MGNYITRKDVQQRLRRNYETLYTPAGAGAVDTDVVDADIAAAEAEVNSELAKRYIVPITDSQALALCKAWALTILEEYAYGAVPGRDLPKHVAERVKVARQQMSRAGDGTLSLAAATVPSERSTATDAIIVDTEDVEFDRENMKGF